MTRSRLLTIVCAVALVVLFALPFVVARSSGPAGERFGGSDDAATSAIEQTDPGYKPWFHSLFQPSSGEVESGLFAMQAALGAGVLGYAIGSMRGRRKERERWESAATPSAVIASDGATTPAGLPRPSA